MKNSIRNTATIMQGIQKNNLTSSVTTMNPLCTTSITAMITPVFTFENLFLNGRINIMHASHSAIAE